MSGHNARMRGAGMLAGALLALALLLGGCVEVDVDARGLSRYWTQRGLGEARRATQLPATDE